MLTGSITFPMPSIGAWMTYGLQDVALAFEPGDRNVLRERPRPRREGIISRVLWQRTLLSGIVMAVAAYGWWQWNRTKGQSADGAITPAAIRTGPEGTVSASWTLGGGPPRETYAHAEVDGVGTVAFTATME